MNFKIDQMPVQPNPGQTLLEMIRNLHLDDCSLANRPLAARIAGEIFTLNYIPVRKKDAEAGGGTARAAMAAANGEIHLIRYDDPAGREAYIRTVLFVVFLALQRKYPECTGKISCTMGDSVYISVEDCANLSVDALKKEIVALVEMDIPLIRKRIPMQKAVEQYEAKGQHDKSRLLAWRSKDTDTFDMYSYEDFGDYFYGEMVPSTGYLTVWDILPAKDGFIVMYPDGKNPTKTADFSAMPHFFEVFSEGERWCQLMECENVADLNELTSSGKIRELIRVNEALHEKRFSQIADMVCERGAKLVMLAGPSSSGKTTSANRLATQLRVHGKKPILMSLDDYYLDRDKIQPGPDGKIDLEHINTIDTDLFRENMADLLRGACVELPTFSFLTGSRVWTGHRLQLSDDSVIIVEGLHGLNPVMLPDGLPEHFVFRLYVSPLLPLNLDDHNRIPTSYLRLLRRIVRDFETRGSTVQRTISMWSSVQNGERLWIFPFQENADVIFNSSTLYELAVLKKHIYPLLAAVEPQDPWYDEVKSIVNILGFVREADVDDEIPPTSLVREFVGGNTFYR